MTEKPAETLDRVAQTLVNRGSGPDKALAALLSKASDEYKSREGMVKWDDPNPNHCVVDLTGSGFFDQFYWELAYEIAIELTRGVQCLRT